MNLPKLGLSAPALVKEGDSGKVTITLKNTLKVPMTNIKILVKGWNLGTSYTQKLIEKLDVDQELTINDLEI